MKAPVDFVVITPLEEERDAVLRQLGDYQELPATANDIRVYFASRLALSSGGSYGVIVMPLLGMGHVEAAIATVDAVRQWQPRYVLLVGIAGGWSPADVALGDVLVSDQIADYELQKLKSGGSEIRWKVRPVDPRLLGAVQHRVGEHWRKQIQVARPGPGEPQRHIGTICTGNKVVANSLLADFAEVWARLVGVEMEAGGAALAAAQAASTPGFFMVRGVSDLADPQKDTMPVRGWRRYACDVAAAYAVALMRSRPAPPVSSPEVAQSASDEEASTGTTSAPAQSAPSVSRYLDRVRLQHEFVNAQGERTFGVALPIDAVYVSLSAEAQRRGTEAWNDLVDRELLRAYRHADSTRRSAAQMRNAEDVEAAALLRTHNRVVILGKPGAGKTTLLRFLARAAAAALAEGLQAVQVRDSSGNETDYGSAQMPVYVRIAEYAARRRSAKPSTLAKFLQRQAGKLSTGAEALVRKEIEGGRALILLDGLDEVTDLQERSEVAAEIAQFAASSHPSNRILVTCRSAAYTPLGGIFQDRVFTLKDMSVGQIVRFLERFCEEHEKLVSPDDTVEARQSTANREVREILREMENVPAIRRLSENPLLLSMIACVHRHHGRFATSRTELYENATEILCDCWQVRRQVPAHHRVTTDELRSVLGPLAIWMHAREPTGLIHQNAAHQRVAELLRETAPAAPGAALDLLRRIQEQTGVFVVHAWKMVGFLHLTFEEYFAGMEVVYGLGERQTLLGSWGVSPLMTHEFVAMRRHDPRWQEVLVFGVGALSRSDPAAATRLIEQSIYRGNGRAEGVTPSSELEEILHRDLLYAARCLGECVSPDSRLTDRVLGELVSLYQDYADQGMYYGLRTRIEDALVSLSTSALDTVVNTVLTVAQSPDVYIQAQMALVLGRLGHKRSSEKLGESIVATLASEMPEGAKATLLRALRDLGSDAATPEIVASIRSFLPHSATQVRVGAALALIGIGEAVEDAGLAIAELLDHNDWQPRVEAAGILLRSGLVRWREPAAHTVVSALKQQELPAITTSALFELLDWPMFHEARSVVEALCDTNWPQDSAVRTNLAQLLGRLQSPGTLERAIVTLRRFVLKDADEYVRLAAAKALGNLGCSGQPEAKEILRAVLSDPNWEVRLHAAASILEAERPHRDPHCTSLLLKGLTCRDEAGRISAARSLVPMADEVGGVERVYSVLQQGVGSRNWSLRNPAWDGLWALASRFPTPG